MSGLCSQVSPAARGAAWCGWWTIVTPETNVCNFASTVLPVFTFGKQKQLFVKGMVIVCFINVVKCVFSKIRLYDMWKQLEN